MGIETHVGSCCGVNAWDNLPSTKKEFMQRVKDNIQTVWRQDTMKGSHFIVTTNHWQTAQARYLRELGFLEVSEEHNTNSGNKVTLWVMSRAKLNTKLRRVKPSPRYNPFLR